MVIKFDRNLLWICVIFLPSVTPRRCTIHTVTQACSKVRLERFAKNRCSETDQSYRGFQFVSRCQQQTKRTAKFACCPRDEQLDTAEPIKCSHTRDGVGACKPESYWESRERKKCKVEEKLLVSYDFVDKCSYNRAKRIERFCCKYRFIDFIYYVGSCDTKISREDSCPARDLRLRHKQECAEMGMALMTSTSVSRCQERRNPYYSTERLCCTQKESIYKHHFEECENFTITDEYCRTESELAESARRSCRSKKTVIVMKYISCENLSSSTLAFLCCHILITDILLPGISTTTSTTTTTPYSSPSSPLTTSKPTTPPQSTSIWSRSSDPVLKRKPTKPRKDPTHSEVSSMSAGSIASIVFGTIGALALFGFIFAVILKNSREEQVIDMPEIHTYNLTIGAADDPRSMEMTSEQENNRGRYTDAGNFDDDSCATQSSAQSMPTRRSSRYSDIQSGRSGRSRHKRKRSNENLSGESSGSFASHTGRSRRRRRRSRK